MNDKELALQEAKVFLDGINDGISKTRDKAWQLAGFAIAISVYLKDEKELIVSISSIIISILIMQKLWVNFFPLKMALSGTSPDLSKSVLGIRDEYYLDCLLVTYQDAINDNSQILKLMTIKYREATYLFIGFLLLLLWSPIKELHLYF